MHIFAANFKMNKTQEETREYFSSFFGSAPKCKVMIAVPYTSLAAAKKHPKWMQIGAQNVHFASSGAYTGEISTDMLKEAGASFTLVAHSERRQYFGETDQTAALRAKAALSAGLEVIFCVGENLAAREAGRTKRVLHRQLTCGLKDITNVENLVVAYEPVWAIGTGKAASDAEIEDAHMYIKKTLYKMFKKDIPVLYGGSVNEENVYRICKIDGVDGALVGGASLRPERMKELITRGTKDL